MYNFIFLQDGTDIPKSLLLNWARKKKNLDEPKYKTRQIDKTFRSIVLVDGQKFGSESWEKNKKHSEQAAALVALHCLDIKKIKIEDQS